ncbi:MAG: sulfotransferase [Devosia sp.]|nr:sulfotransferase [Devosia sp.]
MTAPVRIAMWSGPRNLSTALLRSFSARSDCAVSDEPFYAAFLAQSGIEHPMREAVLASQPTDPDVVATALLGAVPRQRAVWYQKHMAHHMIEGMPLDWLDGVKNAFLIRAPERVLASYVQKREAVTLEDIGYLRQAELFDRVAERTGTAPPVIDAEAVRADPAGVLGRLCAAIGIAFDPSMLTWPAGPHPDDGVWGPHWYGAIYRTTGFAPPEPMPPPLPDALARIGDAARPSYERLRRYCLA